MHILCGLRAYGNLVEGDETEIVRSYLNVVLNWFEELKRLAPVEP